MKKIAIDLRSIAGERAGKGNYAFHLTQNLLKQDQTNHYLLFLDHPEAQFKAYRNIEIHLLTKKGLFSHFEIAQICQQKAIDIFFSPSSYITPGLIRKPTKVIFTVHDLVSFVHNQGHDFKAKIIEKIFLRRAIKAANQILAVSKNTKKDLTTLFPQAKEKTAVIYCAAAEEFNKVKKAPTTLKHPPFFLAVGTIQPRKNYLNLLQAFEIFHQNSPDHELLIVGSKGWQSEEFYQKLSQSPARKAVKILGYLDDQKLITLYQQATAFVFPSFYEGFGIPLLEAMHSACPVICSRNSSIPEVTETAAVFFNPEKPKEIAAAMQQIAESKLLRSQLIERGLSQAQKFSWQQSASHLLALIEKTWNNQI